MKTTTILHEYERRLNLRLARGEITEATRDTYINDASRIFEVLLRHIPPPAIQGFMESEGYRGEYTHIIGSLNTIAREHGHLIFPQVPLPTDPTPNAPVRSPDDSEGP